MEGVGLPKKAKTNPKSSKKRTTRDKKGQNTKMQASYGRTRELRRTFSRRKPKWEKPVAEGSLTRRRVVAGRREKPARVGAWVTFCRRFFLRWVDRAEAIPKVGSPAGNSVVEKVA